MQVVISRKIPVLPFPFVAASATPTLRAVRAHLPEFHSHENESSRIRAYTCMTPSVPPLAYLTSLTAPPCPYIQKCPSTPRQQEPENPSRRPSVSSTETSIKRLYLEVQTLALLWYRPCRGNLNSVLFAAAAVPAHRENFDVSSGLLLSCMWSCTMTRFRCVPRLRG
jgi:hypothetical protein